MNINGLSEKMKIGGFSIVYFCEILRNMSRNKSGRNYERAPRLTGTSQANQRFQWTRLRISISRSTGKMNSFDEDNLDVLECCELKELANVMIKESEGTLISKFACRSCEFDEFGDFTRWGSICIGPFGWAKC